MRVQAVLSILSAVFGAGCASSQPPPVHELDPLRQNVLDAVTVDRVGVTAAHLHELERVPGGQLGDPAHEGTCRYGVAVVVDESMLPLGIPQKPFSTAC